MQEPLLHAEVSVCYPNRPPVLRGVSLMIEPGEIVGLVGQSGSGKSTLALAIPGILASRGARVSGSIRFRGRDLLSCSERELRRIRGREVALALQSAGSALNPALSLGRHLQEAWRAHSSLPFEPSRAAALLQRVDLPTGSDFLDRHPGQISIGQAQRVILAMATMHSPSLLIADEPTSALDILTQAQILDLFRGMRSAESGILFISHDLLSVSSLCDRLYILHQGSIVESGATEELFRSPRHPYTRALIQALPVKELERTSP